jgi:hypothetical protein
MITSRALVAVPMIVVCALRAAALGQSIPENAAKPEAKAVLAKARDTYRNLAGYHFERVLVAQETAKDGTLENIAELTLAIASDNATSVPDPERLLRVNVDRVRVATKTKQNEMLQVCDGRICSSYTSSKNEYMTGQRFRDVNSSVGGSLMLGVHLFAFMTLEDDALQDVKVTREEEVEVGNGRRKCHVIEGVMQPTPRPRPDGPPPAGRPGVDWLVSMLALQGSAGDGARTLYSAWPPDENAAGAGEPSRVTLWIDQNAHVVVRIKMSARLYKLRIDKAGQTSETVAVAVTDSFTTASVEAPAVDLFHFTPPEGAKEVPNVASRRQKQ